MTGLRQLAITHSRSRAVGYWSLTRSQQLSLMVICRPKVKGDRLMVDADGHQRSLAKYEVNEDFSQTHYIY